MNILYNNVHEGCNVNMLFCTFLPLVNLTKCSFVLVVETEVQIVFKEWWYNTLLSAALFVLDSRVCILWVLLYLLVIVFLQSREISGFRYFMKMVSKFTMEELKCVSCVSIANDDENIEAHKICLRKQSNCGNGTMLKIQTSCYRFRKLATDSGILLWIQASCYRFRHLATDSGILLIA